MRPPLGDLGAMYDDHLRLIGKRVVDFLLVLIELFRYVLRVSGYKCKRHGKSAISLQRDQFNPKFQVEEVAPHQSFLHG